MPQLEQLIQEVTVRILPAFLYLRHLNIAIGLTSLQHNTIIMSVITHGSARQVLHQVWQSCTNTFNLCMCLSAGQAQESPDLYKGHCTAMCERHLSSQGWPGGLGGQGGVHGLQQLLEVLLTHGCCLSPVCSHLYSPQHKLAEPR